MAGYVKPKKRLHREFLYLNHDTILNSLSAIEAGDVDEIIQKASDNRDAGLEGGIAAGPVRAKGGKKKSASVQEELVRTRTNFSAFDSWYSHLCEEEAIGRIEAWNADVRSELSVGDTFEFDAVLRLAPIHKLMKTFVSFAGEAHKAHSPFHQKGAELQQTKQIAKMMGDWLGLRSVGGVDKGNLPVYLAPHGVDEPRLIARLDEQYIVGPPDSVEGEFHVVAQVERLLREGDEVSVIRILRDVPPTKLEVDTVAEAMSNFQESGNEFGVVVTADDVTVRAPSVIIQPIAIYR